MRGQQLINIRLDKNTYSLLDTEAVKSGLTKSGLLKKWILNKNFFYLRNYFIPNKQNYRFVFGLDKKLFDLIRVQSKQSNISISEFIRRIILCNVQSRNQDRQLIVTTNLVYLDNLYRQGRISELESIIHRMPEFGSEEYLILARAMADEGMFEGARKICKLLKDNLMNKFEYGDELGKIFNIEFDIALSLCDVEEINSVANNVKDLMDFSASKYITGLYFYIQGIIKYQQDEFLYEAKCYLEKALCYFDRDMDYLEIFNIYSVLHSLEAHELNIPKSNEFLSKTHNLISKNYNVYLFTSYKIYKNYYSYVLNKGNKGAKDVLESIINNQYSSKKYKWLALSKLLYIYSFENDTNSLDKCFQKLNELRLNYQECNLGLYLEKYFKARDNYKKVKQEIYYEIFKNKNPLDPSVGKLIYYAIEKNFSDNQNKEQKGILGLKQFSHNTQNKLLKRIALATLNSDHLKIF